LRHIKLLNASRHLRSHQISKPPSAAGVTVCSTPLGIKDQFSQKQHNKISHYPTAQCFSASKISSDYSGCNLERGQRLLNASRHLRSHQTPVPLRLTMTKYCSAPLGI